MLTDRSASGCDEDIGIVFARAAYSRHDLVDAIASDAKVVHISALCTRQRAESKAVRINDLSGLGPAAGRDKLIAGSQNGHFGSSMHAESRMVHRGGQHQIAVRQSLSLAQQHVVAFEIDPLVPDVASFGGRFLNRN